MNRLIFVASLILLLTLLGSCSDDKIENLTDHEMILGRWVVYNVEMEPRSRMNISYPTYDWTIREFIFNADNTMSVVTDKDVSQTNCVWSREAIIPERHHVGKIDIHTLNSLHMKADVYLMFQGIGGEVPVRFNIEALKSPF